MTSMNLSPKNPVVLLVLAGGALWFLSRRAAAATGRTLGGKPVNVQDIGQRYANPVGVGESLARGLIGMLTGTTPPAAANDATAAADARNRALVRSTDGDYYGSSSTWQGPAPSAVNAQALLRKWDTGTEVDSSPTAPVYDISTDVVQNPWALAGL